MDLGRVAAILGRAVPTSCNQCGPVMVMIAIPAADNCGPLHLVVAALVPLNPLFITMAGAWLCGSHFRHCDARFSIFLPFYAPARLALAAMSAHRSMSASKGSASSSSSPSSTMRA